MKTKLRNLKIAILQEIATSLLIFCEMSFTQNQFETGLLWALWLDDYCMDRGIYLE